MWLACTYDALVKPYKEAIMADETTMLGRWYQRVILEKKECNGCSGRGYVVNGYNSRYAYGEDRSTCHQCDGSGYTHHETVARDTSLDE